MPPRRKATIATKEIKGTISTADIAKADDNVSNQEDPLEFAAAVKRQGRKVAISAKEKGESDNVEVPTTEVSIRSSKQKALHKIISMDKEDASECTIEASALNPSLGDRENICSATGATSGAKHNIRKKPGPRPKKALTGIPEDVAMRSNFVEQGSKVLSDEVKEVSEHCANEMKPDRGKGKSARANQNDQGKLRLVLDEEQQGKEPQQAKMTTGRKASTKIVAPGRSTSLSPIQAPRNLSAKTTECLAMPTEKVDSHSALMSCTREPTKPESKKDQTMNVRFSTRTRKVVCYNEQSPRSGSNKEVSVTSESKAQAATKRNASAAKLLPGGAKRVKEDPTSAAEETLALNSARTACVKRGRRHQKLSSPQNLVDNRSVAFVNHRGTGNKEECRHHKKESISEQVNSSLVSFNSMDSDKALLLQTAQPESVKFLLAQESPKLVSATRLEKTSNAGSSIMHLKGESDHIAQNPVSQNMPLPEKSQDQTMADESTGLKMLSIAAEKSLVQHSIQASLLVDDKKMENTSKGRKVNNKRRALPDAAQKAENDLLDALPLESDEAKSKVLKAPQVQGAVDSMTDAEPEEMYGSHRSVADRKLYSKSQNRGRNTSMRKRTLQGTTQQAKKQKSSVLDTLSSPASVEMLVEGAAPAQTQEHEKVIQRVESQGLNAVEITNSESRGERSSEKKKREEIKRKRASKFDALPVGFGLGISCWSTPPWANQSVEEGVVEELDSSGIDFQVQLKSPVEEAKKQLYLQETAMLKDITNTSRNLEDTHHAFPCSATEMQESSFSISDAEKILGSGIKPVPKDELNHQQEKAKVKRQVAQKAKTRKAVLLESPPAVHTGNDNSMLDKENLEPKLHAGNDSSMLDKENLEPKLHVLNDDSESKMSRSSRRRAAATAGKEKTTRSKKK